MLRLPSLVTFAGSVDFKTFCDSSKFCMPFEGCFLVLISQKHLFEQFPKNILKETK